MDNVMDLDDGAFGYRISNPPIFLATGILGFLEVFNKTSMEQLREKSLKLTGYLEFLISETSKIRCEILTPKDPAQRGCQLSLKFNFDIAEVYKQLVRRGIAVDKRYPYVIRVTPVHFYNTFTDVWRFVNQLVECIKEFS
uniref:Kynureninase n=1 Tax=Panagrolaimus sp. ES5 TaxID=591445 RepID=A0AC34GHC0_9BILA